MCRGGRGGGRRQLTLSPGEGTQYVPVRCQLRGKQGTVPPGAKGANPRSTPTRRTVPPGPKSCGHQEGHGDAQGSTRAKGTPRFGCWEGLWGPEGTGGGAGMLLVPWAVGEWGKGLTDGQHIWGHGLVSQPSQGMSPPFPGPSGPSSRFSKGAKPGTSPQPATPGVQAKPRGGVAGEEGSRLSLAGPPEADRTLGANMGCVSRTVRRLGRCPHRLQ